jgi:hypothetical protein
VAVRPLSFFVATVKRDVVNIVYARVPWLLVIAWPGLAPGPVLASDADTRFQQESRVVPSLRTKPDSTADHSRHDALKGPFGSGPEVTEACLSCHTEAGKHFMQTIHWTWEYVQPDTGAQLGKKTLVNTLRTDAHGNEGVCARCHAGYGCTDDSFDFGNDSARSTCRPPRRPISGSRGRFR